jgi:hypothetical protein
LAAGPLDILIQVSFDEVSGGIGPHDRVNAMGGEKGFKLFFGCWHGIRTLFSSLSSNWGFLSVYPCMSVRQSAWKKDL